MNTEINLLAQKKKQKRDFGKVLIALYVIFGALFIAAIGILVYSFILNSQVNALDNEQVSLEKQITNFGEKRENTLIINERLSSIQKILNTRSDMGSKISTVLGIIPSSFSIGTIDAHDDSIRVRVTSPNLSDFNKLMEEDLPAYTAGNDVDARVIEIGSFAQTEIGYSLTLDFYFTKRAVDRR